ncbi:37-kD nucleoid-associated bacterial protein [Shewanella putrefaciens]|uniref:hypothetical protein n=1 Tax=Shewanella putrefaciens TaxID=24 RepID=UPI000DFAEB1C|nr:hypothetical protein [Shewanella putrefaciens]SUI84835.1 37-kD nucleoid-associated bacterial protein [Shewanella putrefaciens]
MSTRNLVITQEMRDTITIHSFIYHILKTDIDTVEYLTAVTLTTDQTKFFQDMIAESSRGTKYRFSDKANAPLYTQCLALLSNIHDETMFLDKSESIAHNFKATHDKRMADGIVVVTTFSMVVNTQTHNFVAILKLDYKPVLQQIRDKSDPTKVTFQEITDSLLEDKAAIQKRAIVDIGQSFNWDVIAVERGKSVSKQDTDIAIGEHFKNFLSVSLLEDNSVVTRKAITHASKWAQKHAELISSEVKARVISFLDAHNEQNISMDDIRDLLCENTNQNTKAMLINSFNSYMDNVSLSGVQFTSKANSIPKSEKRTKVKTNKNVILQWEGEMIASGITKEIKNGQTIFTIVADNVNDIS